MRIHVKGLCCLVAVALCPLVVLSRGIIIPLPQAVKDSDLIIVGTLRHVSEETRGAIDYGSGELTVDEVLRGNVEAGQKLDLAWENNSGIICPRINHRDDEGKQRIWLLKLRPDAKVAADNPGRYVSIEKKEDVLRLLRNSAKSKKRK
jgi:hypothetical protein